MKKLLLLVVCGLFAVTSNAHAEEKDTGVGKNGVALLSSPTFEKTGCRLICSTSSAQKQPSTLQRRLFFRVVIPCVMSALG